MYIRSKKNKSGSLSIQIIGKQKGKYKVIESIGVARTEEESLVLVKQAKQRMTVLREQSTLGFLSERDTLCKEFLTHGDTPVVTNAGPELVLGKIFDSIGLHALSEEMFRHLVLARLTYPVSKLRTAEYLLQHQGIEVEIDTIYRFLDRFHKKHKEKVEKIIYEHSKKILGEIQMVFYDMTTLCFETENEDDLRKIGFSKDGKFQCPQIMLGLLVGENGYPIAYDIFKGNTFEGHTMIPIIQATQKKYKLPRPVVIADSGLLSKENLQKLEEEKYTFILGARIRNETEKIKEEIVEKTKDMKDGKTLRITKPDGNLLIISFSQKRAKKDAYNREKGIKRLEKKISGGKLTKTSINNRGYNKFLTIENEIDVSLNTEKMKEDQTWDGLKGYITNSKKLSNDEIITNYQHLWKIEKAFRISKSDLRIRPIFHYKKKRIEAHLTIAFTAYAVYKELERQLQIKKINISPARAIELTKTIFQIHFELPDSNEKVTIFNNLSDLQKLLLQI